MNQELLITFLTWVDKSTYTKSNNPEQRYYKSDNSPITTSELVYIFLDSDANPLTKSKIKLL